MASKPKRPAWASPGMKWTDEQGNLHENNGPNYLRPRGPNPFTANPGLNRVAREGGATAATEAGKKIMLQNLPPYTMTQEMIGQHEAKTAPQVQVPQTPTTAQPFTQQQVANMSLDEWEAWKRKYGISNG